MNGTKMFVGMPLVGLLAMATACGSSYSSGGGYGSPAPSGGSQTLMVATDARLGGHLVDGNGRSLYYYAKDVPAGGGQAAVSNCDAICLPVWPLFDADSVVVQGIDAADVGQITRSDGAKQTTYKGYPLYHYVGDTVAGDTRGEGFAGIWYVVHVPAYSVALLSKTNESATYLTDGAGRSLYAFALDTVGTTTTPPITACTSAGCMANWLIFVPGQFTAPSDLAAADLTVYTRADGMTQAAYRGHPLYYYAGDAAPGQTNGRNVLNWHTINPTDP